MNIPRAIVVALVLAVLIIGGLVIYAFTGETNEDSTTQNQDVETNQNQAQEPPTEPEGQNNRDDTRVIDGVEIPVSVLGHIEREYPDYIIDDADREVENGQVYYEIELEHRHSDNVSDIELYYDESWSLIRTSTD